MELNGKMVFKQLDIASDPIFALRHVLEKQSEQERATELRFQDLEKAYVSIQGFCFEKCLKYPI